MAKEFVCTIDNAKFSSHDALMEHIINNYTFIQEEGDSYSEIFNRLQNEFPTASIEITIDDENEVQEHPCISLTFREYGTQFYFRILENNGENYWGETVYRTVDEAVERYKKILETTDVLATTIKGHFTADRVDVIQIYEADNYGDSSDFISFSFTVKGASYMGFYKFDGIDNCIRRLEGNFVETTEGECKIEVEDYTGNRNIYVDGVNIEDLAKRAKKLKVEILEFR